MEREWLPCGDVFVIGDVLRWTDTIWQENKRGRKSKKLDKLGTQRVIAKVLRVDPRGYLSLSVLECKILSTTNRLPVERLKAGEVVRKPRSMIETGSGERLKWSDEAARALIVNMFLN